MKILFWGDAPTINTGFGVVSKNILNRLAAKGHDINVLGINHYGTPYDQKEFPYFIYPCDKGGPEQVFGYDKLWFLVNELKPDILFILNDPWIINTAISKKRVDTPYLKTMAYYPIDSGPLKKEWATTLTGLDAQVCYSNFAEKIVTTANGKRPDNLYQVYHGVNRKTYFPINQQQARATLGLPLDAFVVGMVARNQYRKRFDLLMRAFTEFAEDKPEAKLYLHTAVKDIGFDIVDLSDQFNMGDKLILTEDMSASKGVPEDFLNVIYNTFDVNCLISLGDGFGLPVAESMATGCAQLVSDHSCLKELVDGHGGLTVKNATWLLNTSSINTWGGVSDVEDLKNKLELLYNNQALRHKLSTEGLQYISQDKFNWDHVANSMERIMKDIMHIL
jgi:glycosyltransferase involved in cell wall biosynthesis